MRQDCQFVQHVAWYISSKACGSMWINYIHINMSAMYRYHGFLTYHFAVCEEPPADQSAAPHQTCQCTAALYSTANTVHRAHQSAGSDTVCSAPE